MFNYAKKGNDNLCRECKKVENINHVFIECNVINHNKLKMACARHNIDYTVKNLLTKEKLKYHVEIFLQNFFI